MMKTALFVIAHPDDEAYGPAGTIYKLSTTHRVVVVVMCNGRRPGAEHVANQRQQTFENNCYLLGCECVMYSNDDLHLDKHVANEIFTSSVNTFAPDVVYTHSPADLHADHRIIAESSLVACRPTPDCSVRQLMFFEVPGATDWAFGQLNNQFAPTVYSDVSHLMHIKRQVLAGYSTEVRPHPDARSIEGMIDVANYRGRTIGVNYAEAFQLVYARDHKIL